MEKLFANILNQSISIPETLSHDARHILRSLLERDPTKRIGCGSADGEEIMKHPFFHSIDFEVLAKRKVNPPFKPLIVRVLILLTNHNLMPC
jgi:serine/threonine protein kinase